MTIGIVLYSAILLASAFVDHFKAAGNELGGLTILRAAAVILALVDIYFMNKLSEFYNDNSRDSASIKDILISPFKETKYLITVAIVCLWSFSANTPGPFYSIYLLKDLKVSYSYINVINMLNIPIVILTTPVWAKIIDRTSWFKTLCISMGFYSLYYVGLAFVTENTLILYPVSVIFAFVMASGINLVFSNIPYINIPEKNQTNAIGFYSSMNNLAALISVSLSREFIKKTENLKISIFGIGMQNKQYIVLITAVLMLLAVGVIFILQKKAGENN
jgi:Na+/melibiose symporter-like transporter